MAGTGPTTRQVYTRHAREVLQGGVIDNITRSIVALVAERGIARGDLPALSGRSPEEVDRIFDRTLSTNMDLRFLSDILAVLDADLVVVPSTCCEPKNQG